MRHEAFFDELGMLLGVRWKALVYLFGTTASIFHFVNGLRTFLWSWGVTISERSQRFTVWACAGLGVAMWLLGASTVVFFSTGGQSLVRETEEQRNRASEQMEFEEAARLHKRLEKVHEAIRQRPELAGDLESLHGLVIQRAAGPDAVELFPLWRGFLLPTLTFTFEVVEGKPVSMDARLREMLAG
jgi:hypothetical protein